ncbi:MAG: hypothetical protein OXB88_07145, partial [Bacteriovoracales bacterium]|nr:hypothetical protein [Bacteriovoracales bacterium]
MMTSFIRGDVWASLAPKAKEEKSHEAKKRRGIDLTSIVTARTSSKNCNKGKVTVLHPDKIGRRQRGATEACFLHVAGKRRGSR